MASVSITCPNLTTTVGNAFTAKGQYDQAPHIGDDASVLVIVKKADGTKIFEAAAANFAGDNWSHVVNLAADPPPSPSTIPVIAELQTRKQPNSPWTTRATASTPAAYQVNIANDPCAYDKVFMPG